jgi:hypothetical protein
MPPDLLRGINWIQASYPSPCSDATVQLIGGTALDGTGRVVLDDVVGLNLAAGTALTFLSCRGPGAITSQTTAVLVRARDAAVHPVAERELGGGARVVALDGAEFTVESTTGAAASAGSSGSDRVRQTFTATTDGFRDGDAEPVDGAAAAAPAAIGRDAELVRRSVPPAALCFRWDNVWLAVPEESAEVEALQAPSADLLTIRLALIHVTGRWIDPAGEMTAEMADVVTAYQAARGLTVDGVIGRETTRALEADLGCPDRGGFTMVPPAGLGPRGFRTVPDLVAATERFARNGRSGYASIDQLLRDSAWDGRNAMFLGCYRWQAPASGLSCSWSGATPLQLVGLVDDPATPGIGTFSILYARSTAV